MGSVYQELRPLYFSNEICYHRHFQARPRSRTALPLKSCSCLKFLEFKTSIISSWISKKIFAIQLDSQCLLGAGRKIWSSLGVESRQTVPLSCNRGTARETETCGHCMETKLQQKQGDFQSQSNKEIHDCNSTRGTNLRSCLR